METDLAEMAGGGGSTAGEGGGEGQEAAVEFAVSFEDVLVNVRQNGERVRVLGPATGCVRSGQVLSVVGPAYEAGVMLNALRGAYHFAVAPVTPAIGEGVHVGGTITWNGQRPQDVDARVLAFVDFEADCTIPEAVSCWEVLAYTIKVRVTFLSATEQLAMVDQVLDMLSLAEFAHTPFGLLTACQQRLLRVAREIVGCAGIVFLHDPCAGLSAADSMALIQTLDHLAQKHGYAVTISLPDLAPGLVSVLSQTIVLGPDGRVVYQGSMSRAAAWLGMQGLEKRADFSHKTPQHLVPMFAEFSAGDLLVHGIRLLPPALLDSLVVANADGDAARGMRRSAVEVRAGRVALPALVEKDGMPLLEPGDARWLFAMLHWEFTLMRKDALALHRYLAAPLLIGLALGLLYARLPGPGNILGVQERLGMFTTILLIFTLDGVRRRAAIEDRVTWEDVLAGRLTLATHVGVVVFGEVLLKVTVPAILLAISLYLTAALDLDMARAMEFVLILVVSAWSLTMLPLSFQVLVVGLGEAGVGQGGVGWAAHVSRVLGWGAGAMLGALFVVGGFPLAPADVPGLMHWLRYLSPFAYACNAFVASQVFPSFASPPPHHQPNPTNCWCRGDSHTIRRRCSD